MKHYFLGIGFLSVLLILSSCSKENRMINRLEGNWVLHEMRVVDGEGFTHYIENPEGNLTLNFQNQVSQGMAAFYDDDISNGQLFTNDFSGDSLHLEVDNNLIYFGENEHRHSYSIILSSSKDLILEYYDLGNFQMRKFLFKKD